MDDLQDLVNMRAYHLWERAGRPHGMHQQHWDQARQEIEAERLQAADQSADERPTLRRIVLKARYTPANLDMAEPRRASR